MINFFHQVHNKTQTTSKYDWSNNPTKINDEARRGEGTKGNRNTCIKQQEEEALAFLGRNRRFGLVGGGDCCCRFGYEKTLT
jgi:hypothetical protein